jgi:hypothetical protein
MKKEEGPVILSSSQKALIISYLVLYGWYWWNGFHILADKGR